MYSRGVEVKVHGHSPCKADLFIFMFLMYGLCLGMTFNSQVWRLAVSLNTE